MSFDLKIQNGDLVISSNGDLRKVENIDKLIQDVLKILMTPLGTNLFFTWYGSLLPTSAVGSSMDHQFISTVVEQQIRSCLENLQNLQQQQQISNQAVSAEELLAAIKNVVVKRSITDPTFFSIFVKIVNKAYQITTATLNISL